MPDAIHLLMAVCSLSVIVILLAGTSIGKECYNNNSSYGKDRKSRAKFLTAAIVIGVFAVLGSMFGIYKGAS
jgi:uncharacterized membrane protein